MTRQLVVALSVLLWALPAQAGVIHTQEWSTMPGGQWAMGPASPGAQPSIDCTMPLSPSGGCALKFTYPAGTYSANISAGKMDYTAASSYQDVYVGFWERFSNPFTFHPIGHKDFFYVLDPSLPTGCRNVAIGYGNGRFSGTPQICWADGVHNTTTYYQNVGVWNQNDHLNEWNWYEYRVKNNTPGVCDGIIQMWVNDVPYTDYSNVCIRDVGDNSGYKLFNHVGTWGGGGGTISATGYRWVDHTVISTTRIGRPASIAVEAVSSSDVDNGGTNTASWPHAVGSGNDRLLTVCTQARDAASPADVSVASVTYGGVALTHVPGSAALRVNGTNAYGTDLWYLKNPPLGTATVQINWAGPLSRYGVGTAISYTGVNQSVPIDAVSTGTGNGTTLSTSITTVANHALIADCALGGNQVAIGAGQTVRANWVVGMATSSNDGAGSSTVNDKTPAGAETMEWTQVAQEWAISAVSLKPATATPPPTPVTVDAVSNSATGNTTNTMSWNHTVGSGTNRFLAVCLQARDTVASDVVVQTVTANGAQLVKQRNDTQTNGGSTFSTELWYAASPSVGTNTIVVTWAGALANYGVGSAVSFFGVDQAGSIDAAFGGTGNGAAITAPITTNADHAMIMDCVDAQGTGLTATAGQTSLVNRLSTGTSDSLGVGTFTKTPAGLKNMTYSQDTGNWAISVLSLKPAVP